MNIPLNCTFIIYHTNYVYSTCCRSIIRYYGNLELRNDNDKSLA
jgi:hypothetical protein